MAPRSATARRALLATALTLATWSGMGAARAADDGYENVFTSVLTAVGVMPPQRSPEIEYRERPPLVLPPKTELVKPVASGAARPTSWPADPDVIRRQKDADQANMPIMGMFDKRTTGDRPDSKAEMLRHRAIQEANAPTYCGEREHSDGHCRVTPAELNAENQRFQASSKAESKDVVTAGVEPSRDYLTEPPVGYRKPTRTVKATTATPQPQRDQSNPMSSILPHSRNDDDDSAN